MAVDQSHLPSTSFFFIRNGQEANYCSLQPHDTQFNFIKPGVVQSKKRAREILSVPMNPPPPRPSQVMELSNLLHNPNAVTTGLRLSHELSQNQERQRDELDRFIQIQGEELRCMLAGNRERHYMELLYAMEGRVERKVREKEAELEKATRRHAELEARVAYLAEEARTWQLRAATRESEISSLQAHLQQAIASQRAMAEKQSTIRGNDGDAEEAADDTESVYVDPERIELIGPSCRICRSKSATVMAFPCRHLVLCKECDGGPVRICPICLAVKITGVEVLFS